ncbi:hypothetical protein DFH11DRAFT_659406 [Phellopilus nigrolimitatus]|nr:hypothetical protein DFH11DRAFT_659406 [Phellopilus nigrolimitatus]
MTYHFRTVRYYTLGAVFITSIVVLGLAANFASLFLPHIHRPYTIFAVIVPAATMIVIVFLLQRSMPGIELTVLFLLDVLWLTMASWSSDVIGHVECFSLGGQTQPTKTGTMSLQTYCYEMKAIQAFSWANFAILLIAFIILIILVNRLASMGGQNAAWNASMSDLPWFGQYGSPYGGYGGGGYPGGYPGGNQQAMFTGGNGQMPYVIQQAPGHSVVIQPNPGGVPTVAQIPGQVTSV